MGNVTGEIVTALYRRRDLMYTNECKINEPKMYFVPNKKKI